MRSNFNSIKSTLLSLIPYLFSHHPDCSKFEGDTIHVANMKFCIGCFISYPLALVLVVSCLFLRWDRLFNDILFHKDILLIAGLATGLIQVFSSFYPIKNTWVKTIIKIFLGIGFGLTTVWVFTLPIHILFSYLLFMALASIAFFIGSFRVRNIRKTCANCVYHGNWDICYGWRYINAYQHYSKIKKPRAIRKLIFQHGKAPNRTTEMSLSELKRQKEPDLRDNCRWVYHSPAMNVPWLPGIGWEVEREEDIECF